MGLIVFMYVVVWPVMLWLALGAWPPYWARVVSSSFVLGVVAAVMLLADPWQAGLGWGALPGLVAAYALPFHVKDLRAHRRDRPAEGVTR